MARLGDICTLVNGYAFKPTDWKTEGLPIIRIQNLNDTTAPFNYFEGAIDRKYVVNDGDLLFSWSGTPGTSFGAFFWRRGKGVLNQHIFNVYPVDGVNKAYLRYALNGNISRIIDKAHGGVGLQHITKKELVEIDIPVLSEDQQKKIVTVLDSVDRLIALRKEQLAKLDQLVKSRFIELFGATSADKCSKRIKDYAEVLGGYAFKSDLFCTDAVPVIRISNINNGCVELDYDICFDELFWKQNKKFRAEQNDILMAMSGATTGKAGIYREDMPALINQRVACIRAKDGIAYPTFLFVATQLEWMYDLIQETSAGCAQPNISGKQIENMPVPDATYEQQQQFAAFVEQTDKSKLAIQQSLDKLEFLKKSLMQEYFG